MPRAGEQTTGQLRASLRRAVITADPDGAERRRQQAERQAKVVLYPDAEGTASLSGQKLPGIRAAAAFARITALARALKAAGSDGGIDLLRSKVLIGLLLGTLPYIPPPPDGPPDTDSPPDGGPPGTGGPPGDCGRPAPAACPILGQRPASQPAPAATAARTWTTGPGTTTLPRAEFAWRRTAAPAATPAGRNQVTTRPVEGPDPARTQVPDPDLPTWPVTGPPDAGSLPDGYLAWRLMTRVRPGIRAPMARTRSAMDADSRNGRPATAPVIRTRPGRTRNPSRCPGRTRPRSCRPGRPR